MAVQVDVLATSTGLTTATTAYTAGDVLGAEMSWNLGAANGITGSAELVDKSDITGSIFLHLFDRSVTFGTDNAAPSISDADALFYIGTIEFPQPYDLGGVRVVSIDSIGRLWRANASTTIYGRMVTQTGHTFFGAVGDIQVYLHGLKDV